MPIAVLTWPEAVVSVAGIAGVTLVLSMLIWSIFRTGQTAIRERRGRAAAGDDAEPS